MGTAPSQEEYPAWSREPSVDEKVVVRFPFVVCGGEVWMDLDLRDEFDSVFGVGLVDRMAGAAAKKGACLQQQGATDRKMITVSQVICLDRDCCKPYGPPIPNPETHSHSSEVCVELPMRLRKGPTKNFGTLWYHLNNCALMPPVESKKKAWKDHARVHARLCGLMGFFDQRDEQSKALSTKILRREELAMYAGEGTYILFIVCFRRKVSIKISRGVVRLHFDGDIGVNFKNFLPRRLGNDEAFTVPRKKKVECTCGFCPLY